MKKISPKIFCLDLEGVLIPEIWIEVARRFKVDALKLTTRDIKDYDRLMRYRLKILREKKIKLKDIQKVISGVNPLPGAKAFLKKLQSAGPVIILSDTYYEFAMPVLKKLGSPVLFGNSLKQDKNGFIASYHIRIRDGKKKAVKALRKLNFYVVASGDSYNDMSMIRSAHKGVLFNPPAKIRKDFPHIPATKNYKQLIELLIK